ncbi:hypothetical protein D3C87_1587530 [compost metagenome]
MPRDREGTKTFCQIAILRARKIIFKHFSFATKRISHNTFVFYIQGKALEELKMISFVFWSQSNDRRKICRASELHIPIEVISHIEVNIFNFKGFFRILFRLQIKRDRRFLILLRNAI